MSVIQTNTSANAAYRNLTVTNRNLGRSIEKLSSGFRINRSADDVAGAAIANGLRSEAKALGAAQRNAAQARAVLDIADGTVNQLSSILDRMRELATSSATANVSSSDQTNLDAEFTQLKNEITRIVGETQYQGTALLTGGYANKDFRVGSSTASTAKVTISINALDLTTLGLNSSSVSSTANASGALAALSGARTKIAAVIGQIGAAQNRIDYAADNAAIRKQNIQAAESVIRDLDVAEETTNFTKFQVLQQAGVAMLAQANASSQGVLSLLRG